MDHDTEKMLRPDGPTALAPFAETPREALEEIFGFSSFRDGQKPAVDRLVDGDDALVVMPTGSGKSLCYQLVGTLTEGVTLVVSPLIALMKDQVDELKSIGLPATAINSSMSRKVQQDRIEGMYFGDYKFVYVAPERFRSPTFCEALADVEIGLFAVDEAHCISQWGHDFRPDYRRLAQMRSRFGNPQTVGLTATATEFVQRDIVDQLEMDEDDIVVSGFERPNLYFEVCHARHDREKLRRLEALIDHHGGESIIVYGATHKQIRSVTDKLVDRGVDAEAYHGGMSSGRRSEIQNRWMEGDFPVLVATNAFGMGVDKPDVRAVVHYNVPGSVEAYYQEAGRAGRDGEPAHCLLLFNRADTGIREWFADHSHPLRMQLIRVWMHLQSMGVGEHETSASAIASANPGPGDKLHRMVVDSALRLLARAGHIRRRSDTIEVLEDCEPLELNVEFDKLGERRRVAKEQLAEVVDYTASSDCFQKALLKHFGSEPSFGRRCGNCAVCEPPPTYVETQFDALARDIPCDSEPVQLVHDILKGVARADGRRGVGAVAGMLVGSKAKAVRKAGFTKLEVHGIFDEMGRRDMEYFVELLGRYGLIRRNRHGSILPTSRGVEVLEGEDPPEPLVRALRRDLK